MKEVECSDFYCEYEYQYNLDLLGDYLNENSERFNVPNFEKFLFQRNTPLKKPDKPNKSLLNATNELQQQVFDEVYRQAVFEYNLNIKTYEKAFYIQEVLKKYEATKCGYAHYLTENFKNIAPFLNQSNKLPISENNRRLHTYITGGTGSGKSEAIKSFIWHYLTRDKRTGLILLSPNGEICEQVARFWVNVENDRLIYIEPNFDGFFPCLNPFDIPNKENLTDIEAEKYAESFRSVFEELLQGEFTTQMNTLLMAVLPVIFKLPNSSIYDLIDFLEPQNDDKKHNEKVFKYIQFAQENIDNKGILEFLNTQFLHDNSYNRTKSSIHTRLRYLFNSSIMQAVFVGKSTLDIEQAIEQKKLIIFNFAKGKMPLEYKILGLFVIATIKIISFRRDGKTHFTPCHLFIDEFQNFITPSLQEILEESRKYKLYLTLAQQQAGARMGKGLFASILGNTAIKITGANEVDSLKVLADETGESVKNLQENLAIGRFSVWQKAKTGDTQKKAVFVTMPKNTLGNTQAMKKEQWKALKQAQIDAFYRPLGQTTTQTDTTHENPKRTQNLSVLDEFDDYYN